MDMQWEGAPLCIQHKTSMGETCPEKQACSHITVHCNQNTGAQSKSVIWKNLGYFSSE